MLDFFGGARYGTSYIAGALIVDGTRYAEGRGRETNLRVAHAP